MFKKNGFFWAFLLTFLIAVLIVLSTDAKEGAKNGWELCEGVIIPSLLPIMILTNIIIKSKARRAFDWTFGFLFEKLFRLPQYCAGAVILGLVGGYPAGAVLTSNLFENGFITSKQAQRIMSFNFSSGIAFTITAVGTIYFHNTKTGVVLYLSGIISSVILCSISGWLSKEKIANQQPVITSQSISDAMIDAVETTIKSILIMCAYIILFSSLIKVLNIPSCILPFLEITNGLFSNTKAFPLEFYSLCLCFGGFCIHFQIIGELKKMKIKYSVFLLSRIAGAGISYAITKLYMELFAHSEAVFSNISTHIAPKTVQVNQVLSLIMVLGCAVAVFDIENKKLKLH